MGAVYQAARTTDPIGHGWGMVGILAGVAVGALIVAAGVVTGGAAIALVIAAGALSGAALANGIQRAAGAKNPWTGNIGFGSPNVRYNGLGAARAMLDFATPICNGLYGANHMPFLPIPPIAEGSKTVRINGQPAARVTSRLICAADITTGSSNVWIGGPTVQVLPVIDIEAIVTIAAVGVVTVATIMIAGPLLGAAYIVGGFGVSEGINYLADTYIGPGWGGIINGTLGFLALGLGSVMSRRAAARTQAAERSAMRENVLRNLEESRRARESSRFRENDSQPKISSESLTPLDNNSVKGLLRSRGLSDQQASQTVESFDGQIYARQGRTGDILTVTESTPGSASGVFTTRGSAGATPAERISNLALPPTNTAAVEGQVVLTRPQILLEGRVAPQPEWGADRTGGGWQVVTNGGKYTGATGRLP